jgi:hypothetical protein
LSTKLQLVAGGCSSAMPTSCSHFSYLIPGIPGSLEPSARCASHIVRCASSATLLGKVLLHPCVQDFQAGLGDVLAAANHASRVLIGLSCAMPRGC